MNKVNFDNFVLFVTGRNIGLDEYKVISMLPGLFEFKENKKTKWDGNKRSELLQMRFGFGIFDHPHTLTEIGVYYNLSRARIRQVEHNTIRRLRHPSRAKKIIKMI